MKNEKHNMTRSSEYNVWHVMRKRCSNPKRKDYKYYGAKGIKVCEKWEHSFISFLKDMGPRPTPQHSIDRINSSGNYEPSNCRWATFAEQMRNRISTKYDGCFGVNFVKKSSRWIALVPRTISGKDRKYVGSFKTKLAAKRALNKAIRELES